MLTRNTILCVNLVPEGKFISKPEFNTYLILTLNRLLTFCVNHLILTSKVLLVNLPNFLIKYLDEISFFRQNGISTRTTFFFSSKS